MTELPHINFTYNGPHADIKSIIGLNADESINIRYTLTALRNLLLQNVNIINKLLENDENIYNIDPSGYGIVTIECEKELSDKLISDGILVRHPNNSIEETDVYNNVFPENEETNQDRLRLINNLVNHSDTINIFGEDSSDTDSDNIAENNDIISDSENIKKHINKYINIIDELDSDSSDEYLSNENDED